MRRFGLYEKVINVDPDTGSHSPLLKGDPGIEQDECLSHDPWEETHSRVGTGRHGDQLQSRSMCYCGPGATIHGPFRTEDNRVFLQNRCYLSEAGFHLGSVRRCVRK